MTTLFDGSRHVWMVRVEAAIFFYTFRETAGSTTSRCGSPPDGCGIALPSWRTPTELLPFHAEGVRGQGVTEGVRSRDLQA